MKTNAKIAIGSLLAAAAAGGALLLPRSAPPPHLAALGVCASPTWIEATGRARGALFEVRRFVENHHSALPARALHWIAPQPHPCDPTRAAMYLDTESCQLVKVLLATCRADLDAGPDAGPPACAEIALISDPATTHDTTWQCAPDAAPVDVGDDYGPGDLELVLEQRGYVLQWLDAGPAIYNPRTGLTVMLANALSGDGGGASQLVDDSGAFVPAARVDNLDGGTF